MAWGVIGGWEFTSNLQKKCGFILFEDWDGDSVAHGDTMEFSFPFQWRNDSTLLSLFCGTSESSSSSHVELVI